MPNLETNEVVLIHCNDVNNSYPQNSYVFYTFVPNKSLGQLLDSQFLYNQVLFTDQNSNLVGIKNKINITLVVN